MLFVFVLSLSWCLSISFLSSSSRHGKEKKMIFIRRVPWLFLSLLSLVYYYENGNHRSIISPRFFNNIIPMVHGVIVVPGRTDLDHTNLANQFAQTKFAYDNKVSGTKFQMIYRNKPWPESNLCGNVVFKRYSDCNPLSWIVEPIECNVEIYGLYITGDHNLLVTTSRALN
jgi:hypothetical protein